MPNPAPTSAAYPMVEEHAATGRVAAVYLQVLERMPMVPSLFKSLATCPAHLVLAWRQAASVLDDGTAAEVGGRLAGSVSRTTTPPEDATVREELARFVEPLGSMLVVTAGLRLAVAGALDAPPAGGGIDPVDEVPTPQRDVPPISDLEDVGTLGDVRRDLATPIVNSIWRHLAGRDRLAAAWRALGPQAPDALRAAPDLQQRATDRAADLDWKVAASPAAMEATGCPDAAAGVASVLDAYLLTLPRVLALVASCAASDLERTP